MSLGIAYKIKILKTGFEATGDEGHHAFNYLCCNDASHLKPTMDSVRLKMHEERSMGTFSFGCWNVTTLNYDLAPEHLMATLKNYHYDVITLSETHSIDT